MRVKTALPEAEQGALDRGPAQLSHEPIQGEPLCDTPQVYGHARPEQLRRGALHVHAQQLKSNPQPSPRERGRRGSASLSGGVDPELDQRADGHVKAAVRESRLMARFAQQPGQLGVDALRSAPGVAVQSGEVALGVEAGRDPLQLDAASKELIQQRVSVGAAGDIHGDLEHRTHHVTAVAEGCTGRRLCAGQRGAEDQHDAPRQGLAQAHGGGPRSSSSSSSSL